MKTFTAQDVIAAAAKLVSAHGYTGAAREIGVDVGQLHRTVNGVIPLSEAMAAALGYDENPTTYTKRKGVQ